MQEEYFNVLAQVVLPNLILSNVTIVYVEQSETEININLCEKTNIE